MKNDEMIVIRKACHSQKGTAGFFYALLRR